LATFRQARPKIVLQDGGGPQYRQGGLGAAFLRCCTFCDFGL